MTDEWRTHARLQGRFHPDYPDDVQVVVHDGGPRMSDRAPELVWVRILRHEGGVYAARVLNKPHQLLTVKEGDEILFVVPASGEHLLRASGPTGTSTRAGSADCRSSSTRPRI
jgi:hypothetical protein